jgi:AraC-like DNA-binding protein
MKMGTTHKTQELNIPPLTFGINQIFEAPFDSGWLTFPRHYLLYASAGTFHLEVDQVRWLLPPQRAAWVAAQVPFRLTAAGRVTCNSVLFSHRLSLQPDFTCRVFAVSSLAREMLLYSMRWGPERQEEDKTADSFFLALAHIGLELAAKPDKFWLPQAQSAELSQALDYTLTHLAAKPTFTEVAGAAAISERTLARRFAEETGLSWSQFVRRARMIRAMELLAEPDIKIIDVVYAVGFSSVSAFNHTFRTFTGETPSGYRQRVQPL